MEGIETDTWIRQLQYWEQKMENAKLENDYWELKIQKLKDGED